MKKVFSNISFWISVAVILPLMLKPSIASAHLVTTGMGPVYDGIGHLLLTPEDLVPVFGVALYAGMLGTVAARRALFLLPLSWFSGGLVGLLSEIQPVALLPALSFVIIGTLIAANLRLSTTTFTLLSVSVGLFHGFFNGVSIKEGAAALGLLGTSAALFVVLAIISAAVLSLKLPWTRIVVRIFGSWIGATGILMIGWVIRASN